MFPDCYQCAHFATNVPIFATNVPWTCSQCAHTANSLSLSLSLVLPSFNNLLIHSARFDVSEVFNFPFSCWRHKPIRVRPKNDFQQWSWVNLFRVCVLLIILSFTDVLDAWSADLWTRDANEQNRRSTIEDAIRSRLPDAIPASTNAGHRRSRKIDSPQYRNVGPTAWSRGQALELAQSTLGGRQFCPIIGYMYEKLTKCPNCSDGQKLTKKLPTKSLTKFF